MSAKQGPLAPLSDPSGETNHTTITVTLHNDLLAAVDQWSDDRDRAIAAALDLWCRQQHRAQLHQLAQVHQKRHDDDETGWLV